MAVTPGFALFEQLVTCVNQRHPLEAATTILQKQLSSVFAQKPEKEIKYQSNPHSSNKRKLYIHPQNGFVLIEKRIIENLHKIRPDHLLALFDFESNSMLVVDNRLTPKVQAIEIKNIHERSIKYLEDNYYLSFYQKKPFIPNIPEM